MLFQTVHLYLKSYCKDQSRFHTICGVGKLHSPRAKRRESMSSGFEPYASSHMLHWEVNLLS
uniref:Uncharacterized protein n=1 Tax=Rhizophora mucronata TaxID=61149 RepID=A0A2P2P3D2_RHIMU